MSKKQSKQRVTLKDVAAAANVSVMTVSNVVNGRLQYVSERTRVAVQREIERLNYRTSDSARALRTGASNTIGTLVVLNPLEDRFGSRELDVAFRSFAHQIGETGYRILLKSKSRATAEDGLNEFVDEVDGICVMSLDDHSQSRQIAKKIAEIGKPVIVCAPIGDEEFDEHRIAFVDDNSLAAGSRLAAELHNQGISNILLLDSKFVSSSVQQRVDGVEAEVSKRGMSLARLSAPHGVPTSMLEFIESNPEMVSKETCVICLNEGQAQSVLVNLSQNGIATPDDIQIACVNLNPSKPYRGPDGQGEFKSTITGIWSDSWRIGSAAASAMLTRFDTGRFPYKSLSIACSIKTGDTTGPVNRHHPAVAL